MINRSRRQFLKRSAALTGAMAGGVGLSSLTLSSPAFAADGFDDYKALVCVFLLGGNDSFNMVVPTSDEQYAQYASARQSLAIAQDQLLPLNQGSAGVDYGLHPNLPTLQALYNSQNLAVLGNTGTLIEPTTRQQYLDESVELPSYLFSHSDQQKQWASAQDSNEGPDLTGWGARLCEVLAPKLSSATIPHNLSFSGHNLFQLGETSSGLNLTSSGGASLWVLRQVYNARQTGRRDLYLKLLELAKESGNPFAAHIGALQENAILYTNEITTALESAPALTTPFSDDSLGRKINSMLQMMAVHDALGAKRQIFYLTIGGFDTHGSQAERQPELFSTLDTALGSIYAGLTEIGMADQVTTFTLSDFGRTLTVNGDGTDHGWGGHQLIMGDAIAGGQFYGTMPTLEEGGPDDTKSGRLIPTTSVDQYAATLARWFGASESEILQILPKVSRFTTQDLGFFS